MVLNGMGQRVKRVCVDTVRPQKPKQMVFGIVSVCSMACEKKHKQIGETIVITLARFSGRKMCANVSEQAIKILGVSERKRESERERVTIKKRKKTERYVTADALAMCTLRVHAHCHHLTLQHRRPTNRFYANLLLRALL